MLLQVENIVKNFGGLTALNQVSFHVESGEVVGLIGPNRSCKSTTFIVITDFRRVDGRQFLCKENEITDLPPHRVRKCEIRRTFQLAKLFMNLTMLQNIIAGCLCTSSAISSHHATQTRTYEILDLIGLYVRDLTIGEVAFNAKGTGVIADDR